MFYVFNTVDPKRRHLNGRKVRIIERITWTDSEIKELGIMYRVAFKGCVVMDIFQEEISPESSL